MHITITDETTGETVGTMCVNRQTRTCIVLQSDIEVLDDLASIGAAMKAHEIILFVPLEAAKELESFGWVRDENMVVLTKETR